MEIRSQQCTLDDLLGREDINDEFYSAVNRFDDRCARQYGFQGFKQSLEKFLSRINTQRYSKVKSFIQREPKIGDILVGYDHAGRAEKTVLVLEKASDLLPHDSSDDDVHLAHTFFSCCSRLHELDEDSICALDYATSGLNWPEERRRLMELGVELINQGKKDLFFQLGSDAHILEMYSKILGLRFIEAAPSLMAVGESALDLAAYYLKRLGGSSGAAAEYLAPFLFGRIKQGQSIESLFTIGLNLTRRSRIAGETFFALLPDLVKERHTPPERMLADKQVFDIYAERMQHLFDVFESEVEPQVRRDAAYHFVNTENIRAYLLKGTVGILEMIPSEYDLEKKPWSALVAKRSGKERTVLAEVLGEVIQRVHDDCKLREDDRTGSLTAEDMGDTLRAAPNFTGILSKEDCKEIYVDFLRRKRELVRIHELLGDCIPGGVLPYLHLFADEKKRDAYIELVKEGAKISPQASSSIAKWIPLHIDDLQDPGLREGYRNFLRETSRVFYEWDDEMSMAIADKHEPYLPRSFVKLPVRFKDAGEIEKQRKAALADFPKLIRLVNETRYADRRDGARLDEKYKLGFTKNIIDDILGQPVGFFDELVSRSPTLKKINDEVRQHGKGFIFSIGVDTAEACASEIFRHFLLSGTVSGESLESAASLRNRLMRPYSFDTLSVQVNNMHDALVDRTGSCVSGPYGKSHQAEFAYLLDDQVVLLDLTPYCCDEILPPIARAILVKTTSDIISAGPILLVDGVISGGDVNLVDDSKNPRCGWKRMMLEGILKAADHYCFDKVIVNTEHNSSQDSVHAFTFYVAQLAGLEEGKDYTAKMNGSVREFVMSPDRATATYNKFWGTHHLVKPPMNPQMVRALRGLNLPKNRFMEVLDRKGMPAGMIERPEIKFLGDGEYAGEQFLDTFYAWNEYLGRKKPYVWNDGEGYVRGIELDVKKALRKIRRS